jgi:acetyl-CoA synthetase
MTAYLAAAAAGKPKGVVHCTGGYMVYAHTTTKYVFNMNPGDVYWCTADCGWITGHTYLTYGPLLVGATNVVFEGVPTYPGPDRCWQVVDKYAVSLLYCWGFACFFPAYDCCWLRGGCGWQLLSHIGTG